MLNSFPTRNVINSVENFQSSSSTYETCLYSVIKLCFISVDMWTQNPMWIHDTKLHNVKLVCCVLWAQIGLRCPLIFLKPQIYTDTLVILVQFLNTCPITRQPVIFFHQGSALVHTANNSVPCSEGHGLLIHHFYLWDI
jgi:hypothetical protein